MSDIIQLLPDHVANQIAAGEVVQRPASVVKELLENAIDSGADTIKLIIKDSGKTLIQVIDNGCGMSDTDARLSFERHATSKIRQASDLFNIRTKGFRGEALASIAAIAHVELKTKQPERELGTQISIEGSTVIHQQACACPNGSSFSVKNLFYNVPARRKFLKTPATELQHIIDEFQRVTLAHPDINFVFMNDAAQLYFLHKGSLRQRIFGLFAQNYDQRLIPVEEETNLIKVAGFVTKPEYSKKKRGEQFFFVNSRFFRHSYFNHAITNAFADILASDYHPSYFLYFEIMPDKIDVNIHPTKTEIKFEDEKAIYAIISSAVKLAIGKHNIVPTIDFDLEQSFEVPALKKGEAIRIPTITVDSTYNPFERSSKVSGIKENSRYAPHRFPNRENSKDWEKLYEGLNEIDDSSQEMIQPEPVQQTISMPSAMNKEEITDNSGHIQQIKNKYILTNTKSGIILIDQQNAHERILFEKFVAADTTTQFPIQQLLFPDTIDLSPNDFELVKEIEADINLLGFDIREFGKNTYIIHGIPADISYENPKTLLMNVIDNYRDNDNDLKIDKRERLIRTMARYAAIKSGTPLDKAELNAIVNNLFSCKVPNLTPSGKPTLITLDYQDLDKQFLR